jgi:hypothetical protein
MPNPNPVPNEALRAKQFKPQGEITERLAKRAISVKLPESVDCLVRQNPQSSAWLRRVITEAAQRELMSVDGLNGTDN